MVGGTADLKYLAMASSKMIEQGSRGAREEMLAWVCTSIATSCSMFNRDWYLLICPRPERPRADATRKARAATNRSNLWRSSYRSTSPAVLRQRAPWWAGHLHPPAFALL